MPFKSKVNSKSRCAAAALAFGLALTGCGAAATAPLHLPMARQGAMQLVDPQGHTVSVALVLGQPKATVLVFWAAGCPCVRRYQARIDALVERWRPQGIQVIGVAANADETAADVDKAKQERGFALPVWHDRRGELADAVGARSTPTVVVLLPDGQVVYRGWIDNERQPGDPDRQAWLDAALTRLLAGDLHAETRPTYGCRITRGWADAAPAEPAATLPAGSPAPTSCGCRAGPRPAAATAAVPPTSPGDPR